LFKSFYNIQTMFHTMFFVMESPRGLHSTLPFIEMQLLLTISQLDLFI
jgi:hypothetical protein